MITIDSEDDKNPADNKKLTANWYPKVNQDELRPYMNNDIISRAAQLRDLFVTMELLVTDSKGKLSLQEKHRAYSESTRCWTQAQILLDQLEADIEAIQPHPSKPVPLADYFYMIDRGLSVEECADIISELNSINAALPGEAIVIENVEEQIESNGDIEAIVEGGVDQ